jgi:hypothetical protein
MNMSFIGDCYAPHCLQCGTKTEDCGREASIRSSEARQWNCCHVRCPNCRFEADWWDDNGHLQLSQTDSTPQERNDRAMEARSQRVEALLSGKVPETEDRRLRRIRDEEMHQARLKQIEDYERRQAEKRQRVEEMLKEAA